jgi:Flp pilus assembly protein TadG
MNVPRRFAADEQGATLVEFALVAPVVILVLVACFDFARALNTYVIVANASREGARYASVHPGATELEIHDYVATRIAPLDPNLLTVALVPPYERTTDPRWVTTAPAPGTVTVSAAYSWTAATGLVSLFFHAAGPRTCGADACFQISSAMEAVQ